MAEAVGRHSSSGAQSMRLTERWVNVMQSRLFSTQRCPNSRSATKFAAQSQSRHTGMKPMPMSTPLFGLLPPHMIHRSNREAQTQRLQSCSNASHRMHRNCPPLTKHRKPSKKKSTSSTLHGQTLMKRIACNLNQSRIHIPRTF